MVHTSVWVDHFRRPNRILADLVAFDVALTHPVVIDEIACGTPPNSETTLRTLDKLARSNQATLSSRHQDRHCRRFHSSTGNAILWHPDTPLSPMKSRNYREGSYCGCTPSPDGKGRRHVRSQAGHQVTAGAAMAVVARPVSEAEYRRQMALADRIMDEDRDMLRELATR